MINAIICPFFNESCTLRRHIINTVFCDKCKECHNVKKKCTSQGVCFSLTENDILGCINDPYEKDSTCYDNFERDPGSGCSFILPSYCWQ